VRLALPNTKAKDITGKENYKTISLMNLDAKKSSTKY
jgi:hypothetical protein